MASAVCSTVKTAYLPPGIPPYRTLPSAGKRSSIKENASIIAAVFGAAVCGLSCNARSHRSAVIYKVSMQIGVHDTGITCLQELDRIGYKEYIEIMPKRYGELQ